MTMYLPNSDLHPTGYEPGEFIEVPDTAHEVTTETRTTTETNQWTPTPNRLGAPPTST